ncbi:FAD-binding oxidoreductase [Marinomonas sp. TI.3.20]|uniref:NAD(P)/FAD-dependent oxidoreductase n=1 Tax=Marinomonas sp. TI.3.20 TaxID=3121296 RepID=UPI00311E44E1
MSLHSNQSFWTKTAVSYQVPEQLTESISADVTIIGAGITGLRTALELASVNINVVVIDSHEPGWGASGRTGGQVNPLAHTVPEKVIKQLGDTFGPRMLESYVNSGYELFNLIKKHNIQCDAVQNGWIRGAHSQSSVKDLEEMQKGWAGYGLDISFIEGKKLHNLIGSTAYDVATNVASGGCIQPLSYSRELARVAVAKGAQIFGNSAVKSVSSKGKEWQVITEKGSITSQWVVFCTNGYTDDTLKGLKQTIIPLVSVQAVTRPLTKSEYASILPNGHTLADTRRVIYYSRKDNHDRLLFGSLGMSEHCNGSDKKRLHAGLKTVFPQLTPDDLESYWGGRLAFTEDLLPHIHEPAPGILAGLGYNGRGVAMSTVMGRILSERIIGKKPEDLAIPTTKFKSFSFHRFHKIGVYSAIKAYEMRDAFDIRFR